MPPEDENLKQRKNNIIESSNIIKKLTWGWIKYRKIYKECYIYICQRKMEYIECDISKAHASISLEMKK